MLTHTHTLIGSPLVHPLVCGSLLLSFAIISHYSFLSSSFCQGRHCQVFMWKKNEELKNTFDRKKKNVF